MNFSAYISNLHNLFYFLFLFFYLKSLNLFKDSIKQENRDLKIDSIVEGKEYTEKTIKDHPEYKPGPKANLVYLDYTYGATNSK
jgi:hypothetical protein